MNKKLLLLVSVELIVIVFLFLHFDVGDRFLLTASVSSLSKENLVFSDTTELKSFYEFGPNQVFYKDDKPPWLHNTPETKTNGDALNSRFEYAVKKPKNVFRIVVLGDSWTFGQFVSTKDNFSSRLEDMLNSQTQCTPVKFEVLNLGVGGYDLRYAVERFNLRGKKYDPDVVVWAIHTNDFEEINDFLFPKIKIYTDEFKNQGANSDYTDSDGSPKASPLYVVLAWKKAIEDQKMEMSQSELFAYQDKALRSIRDTYQGKLLLYTWFKVLTTTLEAQYLNVMKDFVTQSPNSFYYPSNISFEKVDHLPDFHPSPSGHEKTAKDILGYLVEHNLIPCTQK